MIDPHIQGGVMLKRMVHVVLCGMLGLSACQSPATPPPSPTSETSPIPTQHAYRSATPTHGRANNPFMPTEAASRAATATPIPTSEPSATPHEAVIAALPDPLVTSQPVPQLMPSVLDPPVAFRLNDQTTYANPAVLPPRSAAPINQATLPNLRLLQKIGLGDVVDVALAPNNQFLAIATSLNVVVYDFPSLDQRYVAHVPAAIENLSISADSATINLLLTADRRVPAPATATIRRYASQTGTFLEETEQLVDRHQWDPSEPPIDWQSLPNQASGYGAYSPDHAFFAHLEVPPGFVLGLGVTIERVADQRQIYTDVEALHLRFSEDSHYAVVFFMTTIRIIALRTSAVQTLIIPAYSYGAFSPDSTLYATSDGFQLFDVTRTRMAKTFPNQPVDPSYRTYTRPTFSTDGQRISNGENIWSVTQTNRLIRRQILPFLGDAAAGMAITEINGDYVFLSENAFRGLNEPLVLTILHAGQFYTTFSVTQRLSDAYFNPADHQIGLIFKNELHLYDIARKRVMQRIQFPYALNEVSFSADGKHLVVSFADNPQSILAALLNRTDLSMIRTFGAVDQHFAMNYDNLTYRAYRTQVPIQIVQEADMLIIPVNAPDHAAMVYRLSDGMPLYRIKQGVLSPDQRLYLVIEGGQIQLWGMPQ